MPQAPAQVVVVGSGFAGFFAARKLARILPRELAEVTMVSTTDHLGYSPLLPEVAAGRRGLGTAGGRGTADRTAPGGPGGEPLLRAPGEDQDGSSAASGAVSGVAGPDDAGAEGAGRVPAGAGDGARPTDVAVPASHPQHWSKQSTR